MDGPSKAHKVSDDCSFNNSPMIKDEISTDFNVDDSHSRKGQFAWATISEIHLPYLIRNGKAYAAVRMVETTLLDKYIKILNFNIYSQNILNAYFITQSEARMLNEINFKHMGAAYGKEQFTKKDLITPLDDAVKLYKFLKYCYIKINNINAPVKTNFGFIKIGLKIIPYFKMNESKYVPSLFFSDFSESLKSKCLIVESWEWAYLKFHCLFIGTKDIEFFSKSCLVINVTEIQNLLQDKEEYEEFAPTMFKDSSLLFKNENVANVPWYIALYRSH